MVMRSKYRRKKSPLIKGIAQRIAKKSVQCENTVSVDIKVSTDERLRPGYARSYSLVRCTNNISALNISYGREYCRACTAKCWNCTGICAKRAEREEHLCRDCNKCPECDYQMDGPSCPCSV